MRVEAWLDPWECLPRLDSFRKALIGFCRIKTLHRPGGTSGEVQRETEDGAEL